MAEITKKNPYWEVDEATKHAIKEMDAKSARDHPRKVRF